HSVGTHARPAPLERRPRGGDRVVGFARRAARLGGRVAETLGVGDVAKVPDPVGGRRVAVQRDRRATQIGSGARQRRVRITAIVVILLGRRRFFGPPLGRRTRRSGRG